MICKPTYKIIQNDNPHHPYSLIKVDGKGNKQWESMNKTVQLCYKRMREDIRFHKRIRYFDEDGNPIVKMSLIERFIIGSVDAIFIWEKKR